MPTYKLTYFNFKALGESIRFLLSYADIDFIDERVDYDNDWPKLKSTTPYGQLPVLEIDEKRIYQSTAICRYLAKQCSLAGDTAWESALIDATVDTIYDLKARIAAHSYETNDIAKVEKLKQAEELVPFYVDRLNKQVNENGGYFVNGKLSWADLLFIAILDYLNYMSKYDIIEKAASLKNLREKVLAEPKILTWIKKRPESQF